EADVLREQGGCGTDRQRSDVFRAVAAVAAEPRDVAGVGEVAGAVCRYSAEVELAVAGEARPAGAHYVRAPRRTAHPVAVSEGVDADAPVDDRNEVRVRKSVEDCPGPRPVDAAEDQIVVERLL